MLPKETEKPTESMWVPSLSLKGLSITEIRVSDIEHIYDSSRVHIRKAYGGLCIGRQIFYKKDEALDHARKARIKKIESLKKQLQKFEKMRF